MQFNTTGGDNAAVGSGSLQNNTTGFENAGVGENASQNTTGSRIRYGWSALKNTAAPWYTLTLRDDWNLQHGAWSFRVTSNTTGSYNTALGPYSMQSNTTGATMPPSVQVPCNTIPLALKILPSEKTR